MKMRIQIRDAAGNIVTDEVIEAATTTDAEINDMVTMIAAGTPAYIAAELAKQHQSAA